MKLFVLGYVLGCVFLLATIDFTLGAVARAHYTLTSRNSAVAAICAAMLSTGWLLAGFGKWPDIQLALAIAVLVAAFVLVERGYHENRWPELFIGAVEFSVAVGLLLASLLQSG